MGYFSIYRIIKDIFSTIFGRKFWKYTLIILIAFTIFFILGEKGAFAVTVDYNNNSYELPDPPSFNTAIELDSRINTYPNGYKYIIIAYSTYNQRFYTSYINSNSLITYTPNNNNTGAIRSTNGDMKLLSYSYENNSWVYNSSSFRSSNAISFNNPLFTTIDILNSDGTIYKSAQSFVKYPEIANSLNDLETLNFDVISVNAWDWSNKDFDILFYDRNNVDVSTTDGLYPKRVITLNKNTSYYQPTISADPNKNAIFWIPIEETGLNFYIGGNYEIRLAERVPIQGGGGFRNGSEYSYNYLGQSVTFTISSNTTQDRIDSINQQIEEATEKKYHEETINSLDNLNNALTNTTPDINISNEIDSSLNFDNQNQALNNLNNGFFSRLTSMLSNLLGYDLSQDTSVSIPLPNSNQSIILHSKDIYDNVTGALRLIINAFWIYIFSFYMWKFINKIYIAVSTGNILDSFSSGGEAITNDML